MDLSWLKLTRNERNTERAKRLGLAMGCSLKHAKARGMLLVIELDEWGVQLTPEEVTPTGELIHPQAMELMRQALSIPRRRMDATVAELVTQGLLILVPGGVRVALTAEKYSACFSHRKSSREYAAEKRKPPETFPKSENVAHNLQPKTQTQKKLGGRIAAQPQNSDTEFSSPPPQPPREAPTQRLMPLMGVLPGGQGGRASECDSVREGESRQPEAAEFLEFARGIEKRDVKRATAPRGFDSWWAEATRHFWPSVITEAFRRFAGDARVDFPYLETFIKPSVFHGRCAEVPAEFKVLPECAVCRGEAPIRTPYGDHACYACWGQYERLEGELDEGRWLQFVAGEFAQPREGDEQEGVG